MQDETLAQFDGELLDGLEFCARVYRLFEALWASPARAARTHPRSKRTRVEKKLLEELLPICTYIQASYRPGRYISVRWLSGTQSYDAELVQRGSYVGENFYPESGYLEVTGVVHPKEHLSRELLDTEGFAFGLEGLTREKGRIIKSKPVSYTIQEKVQQFAEFTLKEIAKKESKPYPEHTTLVVQCTLNLPYSPNEWSSLIDCIRQGLQPSRFREIYLFDPLGRYSHSFIPKGSTEEDGRGKH